MKTTTRCHLLLSRLVQAASLTVLTTLVSCGGGGGGGGGSAGPATVVNADPTGYYDNTGTLPALNIGDLQAMIYNNRLIMVSKAQGYYYDGSITVQGNTITGNMVQFYAWGSNSDTATLTATINSDQSISGTITHASDHMSDSFGLHYATSRGNTTVAAIINTQANPDWTGTLFDASLQPFGNDMLGIGLADNGTGAAAMTTVTAMATNPQFKNCTFSGTAKPITGTSFYEVVFSASGASCDVSSVGGPYTGFAALRSQSSSNDTLVIAAYYKNIANGYAALFGEFQ